MQSDFYNQENYSISTRQPRSIISGDSLRQLIKPLVEPIIDIYMANGVAAGLENSDDVSNRQLIGLAATAQIAIIPGWFEICLVFGFPSTTPQDEIVNRALGFGLNVLTIIVASLATYVLLGAAHCSLGKVKNE